MGSWRLRRLIRFESGQISKALAAHSFEIRHPGAGDPAEPAFTEPRDPEMDALTDHLFLPEKEDLDKLLRCEDMMSRQLNHAIAELQALRKGEPTVT